MASKSDLPYLLPNYTCIIWLLLAIAPYYLEHPRLLLICLNFQLPSLFASQSTSKSSAPSTHNINISAHHTHVPSNVDGCYATLRICCDIFDHGNDWIRVACVTSCIPSKSASRCVWKKGWYIQDAPPQKEWATTKSTTPKTNVPTEIENNNQPDAGGAQDMYWLCSGVIWRAWCYSVSCKIDLNWERTKSSWRRSKWYTIPNIG